MSSLGDPFRPPCRRRPQSPTTTTTTTRRFPYAESLPWATVDPLQLNGLLISKLGFLLRDSSETTKKENNAFAIPSLTNLGYTSAEQPEDGLKHRGKGGFDFMGGEMAGLQLLDTMMQRHQWVATFEKPKTSPNALTVDTTGLSPCK